MRRAFLYTLLSWCVLTTLFSPIVMHLPCPIESVMMVIKINAFLSALVSSFYLLVYLPRAFYAPTAMEMQIKVKLLEKAEQELASMRTLQLAKNQQKIENSVRTLDSICAELRSLLPEKYRNARVPSNGQFLSNRVNKKEIADHHE